VGNLVIDYPFGLIGKMIQNKDVTPGELRVSYVPLEKDEMTVNAVGGKFRG
jgi:hypothetical protein